VNEKAVKRNRKSPEKKTKGNRLWFPWQIGVAETHMAYSITAGDWEYLAPLSPGRTFDQAMSLGNANRFDDGTRPVWMCDGISIVNAPRMPPARR
jgi:hypothetical protein